MKSKDRLIHLFASLLGTLGYPWRKPRDKSFLIVSTTGIGDTLWGVPAIRALRQTYPEAYIAVLTKPLGAELLKCNPDIDKILTIRRGLRALPDAIPLIGSLFARRFSTVLVFHVSERIIWPLVLLAGAPRVIGAAGAFKHMDRLLTEPVGGLEDLHFIDRRLSLVARAGAHTKDKSLALYLDEQAVQEADKFMAQRGLVDKKTPLLGLHPGAKDYYKCAPPERFIEAGARLAEKYGLAVVVLGGTDDQRLCAKVAASIPGAVDASGALSVRGSGALMKRLKLFITNDTGPMHMAFALGVPTVALFGPTLSKYNGPVEVEAVRVLSVPRTCEPCLTRKCKTPRCLEALSTEQIVSAAEGLMSGTDFGLTTRGTSI